MLMLLGVGELKRTPSSNLWLGEYACLRVVTMNRHTDLGSKPDVARKDSHT